MKNEIWQVKDMLEYAIIKYHLIITTDEFGYNYKDNYSKRIRDMLKDYKLVQQDQKGNYNYQLPKFIAMCFIDNYMKEYFETPDFCNSGDKNAEMVERFKKSDDNANNTYYDNYINVDSDLSVKEIANNCFESIHNGSSVLTVDRVETEIMNVKIQAIFDMFFDFDERAFIDDLYLRESKINREEQQNPFEDGYSAVNSRLQNYKNYIQRKKNTSKKSL